MSRLSHIADFFGTLVRTAWPCAAVVLLATTLFFLLHHFGNQLPHDLAVERFKAELESDRPDPGHAKGYKTTLEYCLMSSAALAGARQASETAGSALRNTVLLRTFQRGASTTCDQLEAAANGAAVPKTILPPRYWHGGKALYAIALRYGSVYDIRNLMRIGTYAAYALLAISLLLLSPKVLLLASPLLAFGAFFSGIEYWAGVANGLPYLWTVLFAAGLALLARLTRHVRGGAEGGDERTDAWGRTVPVYCFAAGTVSSYLYFGDGHTFLAVAWIGMVVWFGCGALNAAERTRRAVSCIVLYGTGIVVCYILGQAVKAMFLGEAVWLSFWHSLGAAVEESAWGASRSVTTHPLAYLDSFYTAYWPYAAYWPRSWPSGIVPTFVAAAALAVSLGFAVFEARRGRSSLFWCVLWIVGLMASCSLTFLIVDDIHHRTARYVFVPLALCLSCLLLSLRTMHWRMSAAAARRLSAALLGLVVVAGGVSWYLTTFNSRTVDRVIESVEGMRPVASSVFDVYLDEDRLVYVREGCSHEDVAAPFFLQLYPADVAHLYFGRQPHGYDNLDFPFWRFGLRGDGRCAAVRVLPICIRPPCTGPSGWPPYELVVIRTGQYMPKRGPEWEERIVLPGAVDKVIGSVEDMRPDASSSFDVYFDEGRIVNRLVYVKEECSDEDVHAPFFLHLHPADVADLPPHRRPDGYGNLDFSFETNGFRGGGRCAVARLLPDYEVAAIETGQYEQGQGTEWSERINLPGAVDKMIESVEDMQPAASSVFDVYFDEDRLVYVKENCSDEDLDAPFFLRLHLHPHGYVNLDFSFETHGLRRGERCAAEHVLPDYQMVAIETGQNMPGEAPEWSERIDLPGEVDKVIESVEDMPPAASAVFDVYLDGNRLVYVKQECGDEDIGAPFFLHFHPADVADLPPHRRPDGFANLDFSFETHGLRGGGRCAVERLLPDYELIAIDTGQYVPGQDPEWSERIDLSGAVDKLIESVEDLPPAASAAFDVYLDEDRLVYVKEQCAPQDVAAPFFLHFHPADVADLQPHRRPHGFANLDFAFETHGLRGGGRCAVERLLPDYGLVAIDTGQYVPGQDPEWSERIDLSGAVDKLIESVEDLRPAAKAVFDVYLDGNRLVYVKEQCAPQDVDAPFFLHLHPADVADLQPNLQLHGFANLDFAFETHGLRGGGRCAAERLLPDYEVIAIQTGQYEGEDRAWSARINLSGAVDKLIEGVEGMRPAASAVFDVYLDGNRLVYVKEECSAEDVAAPFFLHLHPADVADLPHDRRGHGFDNFDFAFETVGLRGGGRCAVERLLPDYESTVIQTGQYVPGEGREWSARIGLDDLR